MELDSQQLEAVLAMLREQGVEEFEGLGIHVKFSQTSAPQAEIDYPERPVRPRSKNPWEDESLWQGAKPPQFYKKDTK